MREPIITNNFSFLCELNNHKEKLFFNLQEFLKNISDLEKRINEKDFLPIASQIRTIFEGLINDYINFFYKDIDIKKEKLFDKLEWITKKNDSFFTQHEKQAFTYVRIECNNRIHCAKGDYKDFQVLNLLYNFHTSLINILKLSEALPPDYPYPDFENIYLLKKNKIIENDEEEFLKKKSNYISNFIDIQRIKLFDFLFNQNNQRNFLIPIYQRSYNWTKDNVDDLLEDVYDMQNEKNLYQHYFGIIAAKKVSDNENQIKIIDGQQRITTSILIVCAIKKIIKNNNFNKTNLINSIFFCIDKYGDSFISNPIGQSAGNDEFRRILRGDYDDNKKDIQKNSSVALINFFYIVDQLTNKLKGNNFEYNLNDFLEKFSENFIIGLIGFDEQEYDLKKELIIFENLNTKGKKLNLSDLIKNLLFTLCDKETLDLKEKSIINVYNTNLICEIDSYTNSKDNEKVLEEFFLTLMHYFIGEQINKKENSSLLLKKFSKMITDNIYPLLDWSESKEELNINDFEKLIGFFKNYLKFAFLPLYFRKKELSETFLNKFNLVNVFKGIIEQKMNPFYPLAFFVFEFFRNNFIEGKFNIEERKTIYLWYLHILKIILFHLISSGVGDTYLSQKIYKKLNELRVNTLDGLSKIQKTFFDKLDINFFIDDKEDFFDKLKNCKEDNWRTTKILFLIENYFIGYKNFLNDTSIKDLSLEHLMPKELNNAWYFDLKKWDVELALKDNNEINKICKDYINEIGNFILLPKSKNSSIKNEGFLYKISEIKKSYNNNPLFSNDDYHDIDIKNKKEWTKKDIEKRSDALNTILMKIFDNNDFKY